MTATDYEGIRQRVLDTYRNAPIEGRDPQLIEFTAMLAETHAEITLAALKGMNEKQFPLGVMMDGLIMVSGSSIRNVIRSAGPEHREAMIRYAADLFSTLIDPGADDITVGDIIVFGDYKAN